MADLNQSPEKKNLPTTAAQVNVEKQKKEAPQISKGLSIAVFFSQVVLTFSTYYFLNIPGLLSAGLIE